MRNISPSLGPPWGPRHGPTAGSYGVAVSYKRGTRVRSHTPQPQLEPEPDPKAGAKFEAAVQGYLAHNKPRPPRTLQ
jgi:hypothetical protein